MPVARQIESSAAVRVPLREPHHAPRSLSRRAFVRAQQHLWHSGFSCCAVPRVFVVALVISPTAIATAQHSHHGTHAKPVEPATMNVTPLGDLNDPWLIDISE